MCKKNNNFDFGVYSIVVMTKPDIYIVPKFNTYILLLVFGKMEDMDISVLGQENLRSGIRIVLWGVAVINSIAYLVRITPVSRRQPSTLVQVLCPPLAHLHSTSNMGNQQLYTLTGAP